MFRFVNSKKSVKGLLDLYPIIIVKIPNIKVKASVTGMTLVSAFSNSVRKSK